MSNTSSSVAAWFTHLQPYQPPAFEVQRPHDPLDIRLGQRISLWNGDPSELRPDRPVLIGFPQDEGVRRNLGRVGSALAPQAIRSALYRLTSYDPSLGLDLARLELLDAGDVQVSADLEANQVILGQIVGAVLQAGAIPVVVGGGHETAFGTYLGYVEANLDVFLVNIDAHLDVRTLIGGKGTSGTPFRQALEHPTRPLPGRNYAVLGAQPFATAQTHLEYLGNQGAQVVWRHQIARLPDTFRTICEHRTPPNCPIHISVDADVVNAAEVPGVSAPNALGLSGAEVVACIHEAARLSKLRGLDLVEINPMLDGDGRSARWAAVLLWHFLSGLAARSQTGRLS